MAILKVVVTGYVETTFIGSDEDVYKFLTKLKKDQYAVASKKHLSDNKKNTYYQPSYCREEDREKNKQFGLKIQITKVNENRYF